MTSRLLTGSAPLLFLLLWSAGFVVAKIGIVDSDPLTLLALRYFCVILLLLPFCLILRPALPKSMREWWHLVFVGFLIQVVYFGTAYLAFEQGASAGGVALITSMQPILVAFVMPGISQEVPSQRHWLGLILGLTGAVLVLLANAAVQYTTLSGILLALCALIAITTATVWEKQFGIRHHPLTANAVQYSVGFLFTLPMAWLMEDMAINWTLPFALSLAYLVIANSILAISLLLFMIRQGAATRVSALFFLVPPITALIAWQVLGEPMAPAAWTGLIVAALGVYLATRKT